MPRLSRHRFHLFWLSLSCLLFTVASGTTTEDPNFAQVSPPVKSICRQAANTPIPPKDTYYPGLAKTLENCNAADLYYGIHGPVDYAKARQCAYLQKDFSTLIMIYANAKGTPRNWGLAIYFACRAGFAPAEIESRVMHLVQLRDQHSIAADFDICEDVTSGYMMGVCVSRQNELQQVQRHRQLDQLTASWSKTDKAALARLQQAADAFFATRSINEVDLSGTSRATLETEEKASLCDDFLASLQQLNQGKFPAYSAQQATQLDRRLNAIYQQIEKNPNFSVGTIDRAGVRKTQYSWLQYREAWVEFAKVKYPQIDAQHWRAWLTAKRIQMLQDLVN